MRRRRRNSPSLAQVQAVDESEEGGAGGGGRHAPRPLDARPRIAPCNSRGFPSFSPAYLLPLAQPRLAAAPRSPNSSPHDCAAQMRGKRLKAKENRTSQRMPMPLTISVLNKKGGVGKTSTCHHVAGSFAKRRQRVLLIDNDPQASLTQGLCGCQAAASLPASRTLAALYDDSLFGDPATLIQPTAFERIFPVPGSAHVTRFNLPDPHQSGTRQVALRDFVRDVGQDFDVILIDCPPNLQLCSWAALVASDFVLVPLQAEDY